MASNPQGADGPARVELLGRAHVVTLPDFAAREELVIAYAEVRKRPASLLRVYSAAIGLCTRIGREAGADYAECRFDVLAFGGKVYGWLREKGVAPDAIAVAAVPLIVQVSEATFPRQGEVDAAAGNSAGGAES